MIASVSVKFPWKESMTGVTRPFLSDTLAKKDKARDPGHVSFSLFTNRAFLCSFAPMGLENQRIEYELQRTKGKDPNLSLHWSMLHLMVLSQKTLLSSLSTRWLACFVTERDLYPAEPVKSSNIGKKPFPPDLSLHQ